MKYLISILLLTSLWGAAAKAQHLNVITYNLRGDNATDVGNLWADRKLMVVSQFEKYKPDIIGLQETLPSMAGYLIDTLPRFDSIGFDAGIQVGLLYNTQRLMLQSHGHFYLSATPDVPGKGWDAKFARMCVWAKFNDQVTNLEFYVFCSHFDHVGTVARTNSVQLILQKINEIAGTAPTLFMGDLNTTQWDANYITLNNSVLLKDTKNLAVIDHEKERGTGNGFNIDRRERTIVDYVFATNTWKAYEHDVLLDLFDGHTASDHYAVMTILDQKENDLGELYRQFPEDFENPDPVKTSYASGDVVFRTGTWTLNNAIIGGSSANDKPTSGTYGVRIIDRNTAPAYLQMNFDVTEGASRVTLQHSTYATDSVSKWQLEYSTNQGLTWAPIGPVISTHQLNKQQATFIMDIPGNVRFRINKFGLGTANNGRLDIDDLTIYKRKNAGPPKKTVPLLGWQFGSPASTGAEVSANSSINNAAVNVSSLTRGTGFKTVSGSSGNISLPGGFGAAASVASTLYASDTTVAINNNLYFQFTVKPKASQRISLSTIDAKLMSTGSTLKLWYWKYSLDGVNFKYLAKSYLFNAAQSTSQATIDLSAYPELQHIGADKTVYFRLYVNGMDNSSDMAGIGVSNPGTADDYALSVGGIVEDTVSIKKLAAWQFATPLRTGGEASAAASLIDSSLNVGLLQRGAGLRATDTTGAPFVLHRTFVSLTSVPTTTAVADTATAISQEMYYAFSVGIKPGYKASLSNINYKLRVTPGGAKVFYWKYSLDGINFERIANPRVLSAATADEGDTQPPVDLSCIGVLQDIPAGRTVYFRMYTNGSNTSTGTTAFGRSATSSTTDYVLTVNGNSTVVTTPEKLVAWQLATPAKAGNETDVTPTTINNAVTATPLVRGAGLNPTGLARAFASLTTTPSSSNLADTAIAIANNMYFGFSIAAKTGQKISLNGLDFKIRATGGGAKVYYWKYSLNGTDFYKADNPFTLAIAANTEGEFMPHVDLSEITELQNLPGGTTVTFRLYTNGSNTTTGSTAIGRSTASTTEDILWVSGSSESEGALLAAPASRVAPVGETQITALKAILDRKQVILKWQAVNENPDSHFEVLRFEGTHVPFVIGQVRADTTGSSTKMHDFADLRPLSGTSSYQIRTMDRTGHEILSEKVKLIVKENNNDLLLSATGKQLTIFIFSDTGCQGDFSLRDIMGRTVISRQFRLNKGRNVFTEPVNVPPGIFTGTIIFGKADVISKKILL